MTRVALLTLGTFLLLAASPWIGLTDHPDAAPFIVWQLRVPRLLMALLVGLVLGTTGAVFQALFRNPLATPSTTGTTAGATLGALAVLVLAPGLAHPLALAGGAFSGAIVLSLGVTALAMAHGRSIHDILLAGVALTLGAGALTMGLQATADMSATFRAVQWSLGSLSTVGYRDVLWFTLPALLVWLLMIRRSRALDALLLGEAQAHGVGVDPVKLRTELLWVGSLGVACAVAITGPIAFVGLVVPHLVRRLAPGRRKGFIAWSGLSAGAFLALADLLARHVLPGRELPVGVMTAAIGAPFLVALVLRKTP